MDSASTKNAIWSGEELVTRTGIVVALAQERDTLRCLRDDARFTVRLSGIGPENAAEAASALLNAGCSRLVSWGFAGALTPEFHCGAVVEPGRVRGVNSEVVHEIPDAASDAVLISTADVADSQLKARLGAEGASLVDMESHAIGLVCRERGVPFHVYRVVVDSAGDRWIDDLGGLVNSTGRLSWGALMLLLLRNPRSLLAAARASWTAQRSLRRKALDLARSTS